MRQDVLEGRNVKDLIFQYIDESVRDAVHRFLDKKYVPNCIGEWVYENISVAIDADRFRGKDREDLHKLIHIDGREEASGVVRVTIGEYIPIDTEPEGWDLQGLADWANATYKADLKVSALRTMTTDEIIEHLERAAEKRIDEVDLAPLDQYLVPNYGEKELVGWASNKFAVECVPEDFVGLEDIEEAADKLMAEARKAYTRREMTYPIDFAIDMTSAMLQQDPERALEQFCSWVKSKYELDWHPQMLPSADPMELKRLLLAEAEKWDEARITERAERAVAAGSSPDELDAWFQKHAGAKLTDEERTRAADDPQTVAEERIAAVLRAELTRSPPCCGPS